MKNNFNKRSQTILLTGCFLIFSSFFVGPLNERKRSGFPYKKAGLSIRQAAAHLAGRFTYGATPGEIDKMTEMGLENWFQKQLEAKSPDSTLDKLLGEYDALNLTNREVLAQYPKPGQALRMAVREGVIDQNKVQTEKKEYQNALQDYMNTKGLKPMRDLQRQFISQKVLRAAYSNNQLAEVMTSFWFNHFNVSLTKNDCAQFVPSYERDVIRPNALGNFSDLLLATAKAPAMLYFLDNFSSTGAPGVGRGRDKPKTKNNMPMQDGQEPVPAKKPKVANRGRGLNENYAREVMELHTLGVDGGYTQQDVTEAARVLTGWTVVPMGNYRTMAGMDQMATQTKKDALAAPGNFVEGDFLFAANRHDGGEKKVLGRSFGPGAGYEEGVALLNMLAHHPSAAQFISKKLAIRFVSDNPPQSLVDKMAKTFKEKDGDIKQVMLTMVNAPEFWSTDAIREKTKSPFELAIGAVRGLNAQIVQPFQLFNWISRMGERMYFYQAPTGFPDKGQYWINTGSLLNRMNFGLALASGRVPGVQVDLLALNNQREPESMKAALRTYGRLLMPERDLEATMRRLEPMLNDPQLFEKVDKASSQMNGSDPAVAMRGDNQADPLNRTRNIARRSQSTNANQSAVSRVVGVILGSPEYQRR